MPRRSWRETQTPHTFQYALPMLVFILGFGDLLALVFVGLSMLLHDRSGGLYFIAQWSALMVWVGAGYWLWRDRDPLWRQWRARRKRAALRSSEFDT